MKPQDTQIQVLTDNPTPVEITALAIAGIGAYMVRLDNSRTTSKADSITKDQPK